MKYWCDEVKKKYSHLIMLDSKEKELEKLSREEELMKEYEDKLNY